MMDVRLPKYQWGQPVSAAIDLVNDGSHPNAEPDALLVAAGTRGEVVQVGRHVDSNMPVYLVEFGQGVVVGCIEEELVA